MKEHNKALITVTDHVEVEAKCTECGRYIGPIVTCPFCGHRVKRHSRITLTKNLALAFAIVGLLALHGTSMIWGTPAMNIEDLSETTNYAYVELSGVVVRAPTYYPGDDGAPGTIYFTVDDGTGQISVRAYPQPVVRQMLEQKKIPAFGDRVNVTGNVYWYNAERGFILNSLTQLEIDRPTAVNMTVSDIASLDPEDMDGYYRARTFGTVTSWRKFAFSVDVTITDEKQNEISVYVPNSVLDLTGTGVLGTLNVGMGLEVEGCLEYYDAGSYSKWEIIPATSDDIKLAQPDLAMAAIETSPLSFPLNQQFTVNTTIVNNGPLPVQNADLNLYFNDTLVYTTTIGGLAAGDSYVVYYDTYDTISRPELFIRAEIIPDAPLVDVDDSNNSMTVEGGA